MPLWRHLAATAAASSLHHSSEDSRNLMVIQGLFRSHAFGRSHAPDRGMLRITLPTARHSGLFILEGRLTGLWARELLRVARGTNQGSDNIFDLQEVFFVDSEGEQALRLLAGWGARFITESAYGKDLCNRLKLRRVAASNVEGNNGKRLEGFRKPRQRRNAHAGRPDALAAADANQHPSSCRG